MIRKDKRDQIVKQALEEIAFAREYKDGRISNWKKNEDLYYGKKTKTDDARANVDLGKMQEFVHSLLSKINTPLVFKYTKRKDAQLKRVNRLNSLVQRDRQMDNWDIKDLVGKKQGVIYGRAVYSYFADSEQGYRSHLNNVDVYDFLIDPSAGGIEIERANFLGDYGVVLSRQDLEQGVKDKVYLRTETKELLDGAANNTETTNEENDKRNRTNAVSGTGNNRELFSNDKFKFWRWGTTFEGERYYLLMTSEGRAVRIEKLEDVFASNLWWYWSFAVFPDLTEFWTPSYCDYVREIFMAQSVTINQMLDNAEKINKPQKLVNVMAVENLAELKYRKDGYIKVKGNIDVDKAVQVVQTPSITTPLNVYDKLEAIQEKASGVTAGSKGVSEEDKVGIYEGNQANANDRFELLHRSLSFGTARFAKLYEHGVREHLTKKVAVDILGPGGVEIEDVSKRDIFWKDDQFGVMVEASNADMAISETEKRTKIAFLSAQAQNQIINPKKAFEMQAKIVGMTDEEIRQLLDVSEFGDAELMSEAERDIELILDGKTIKPNQQATTAYKQRFIDFMNDHEEDIDMDDFERLVAYIAMLEPVINRNMVSQLKGSISQQGLAGGLQPPPQTTEGAMQQLEPGIDNLETNLVK